jgi:hypothetical protein
MPLSRRNRQGGAIEKVSCPSSVACCVLSVVSSQLMDACCQLFVVRCNAGNPSNSSNPINSGNSGNPSNSDHPLALLVRGTKRTEVSDRETAKSLSVVCCQLLVVCCSLPAGLLYFLKLQRTTDNEQQTSPCLPCLCGEIFFSDCSSLLSSGK